MFFPFLRLSLHYHFSTLTTLHPCILIKKKEIFNKKKCGCSQGVRWDRASPLSQGQGGVVEEGELLLQAAHTEGQVARRQDEQDNADEKEREKKYNIGS